MNVKSRRIRGEPRSQLREFVAGHSRLPFEFRLMTAAVVLVPIFRQLAHGRLLLQRAGFFLRRLELGLDRRRPVGCVGRANVVGINLPQRRMLFDPFVEQRLRDGGIVHFAVPVATIADHIDHHISAELVAIFHRHASHAHHRIHILAIHVKNRNGLPPRNARRKPRRVFFAVIRGEAQQIVRNHVNRAAHGVARKVGVVHGLGQNSLPGKRGIAVHQQRQIGFASAFAGAILLRPRAPNRNRIDRFQMAGIRNQVNVNFRAAARDVLPGRAHVIFHVARSQHAARIDILEAGKNFLRRTPGHMRHYVEASAMAHAHHQFSRAALRARVQNFIHQRQQRGYAFQRKPFAAQITLLHHLLENVGADQQIENPLLVFPLGLGFHLLINPLPPLRRINVVDLHADGAGINRTRFRRVGALDPQLRHRARSQKTQRIEVALQVSPLPERLKHALALRVQAVARRASYKNATARSFRFRSSHK